MWLRTPIRQRDTGFGWPGRMQCWRGFGGLLRCGPDSSGPAKVFRDITQGDNGVEGVSGYAAAGAVRMEGSSLRQ